MGNQADNFAAMVQKWWAQPFNAQGSVGTWFLFFGLVIVILIAWQKILKFVVTEV